MVSLVNLVGFKCIWLVWLVWFVWFVSSVWFGKITITPLGTGLEKLVELPNDWSCKYLTIFC